MKKITALTVMLMMVFSLLCFVACSDRTQPEEEAQDLSPESTEPSVPVTVTTKEEVPVKLDNVRVGDVVEIDGVNYSFAGRVEFGMYPQTVAEKKALKAMSPTTDSTGYYYSTYDNEHYARVAIASVYGNKYEFVNEKEITPREVYYFKVEPIVWQVFGQFDVTGSELTRIYLVSECVLDSSSFLATADYEEDPVRMEYFNKNQSSAYANDWLYSSLRTWLNSEFYSLAFSKEEKDQIISRKAGEKTIVVKEGEEEVETTEILTDNVFVPTVDQAKVLEQKLSSVSDYARCRATFMSIYPDYYGYGRWWTMSPGATTYQVAYGGTDDNVKVSEVGESVGATYMGVRPSVIIDVKDLQGMLLKDDEDSKKK